MSQIPISPNSFAKINVIRTRSILLKNGKSVTWDNVISAMSDVVDKHLDEFGEIILTKHKKVRVIHNGNGKKPEQPEVEGESEDSKEENL